MDLNNLMQMATQLKERLDDAQAQAGTLSVTGEAGGGLVRVSMNGRQELTSVKIDKAALKGEDTALLEDLIIAAVNQASRQVGSGLKDKLGNMAQDLGIDMNAFAGMGGPAKK